MPDSDPTCDLDGQCNDRCTLGLRVCANQPGVAGCTPPTALDQLRVRSGRGRRAAGRAPPDLGLDPPTVLEGPACTETVTAEIPVTVRPNPACTADVCFARRTPGRVLVTALARSTRTWRMR